MIDWFNLAMNSLWILGCSVALAVCSYASWEASAKGVKFWAHLKSDHFQLPLNLAGMLFSLGLAGTADTIWERVVFIIFALLFLVQGGMHIYSQRKQSKP